MFTLFLSLIPFPPPHFHLHVVPAPAFQETIRYLLRESTSFGSCRYLPSKGATIKPKLDYTQPHYFNKPCHTLNIETGIIHQFLKVIFNNEAFFAAIQKDAPRNRMRLSTSRNTTTLVDTLRKISLISLSQYYHRFRTFTTRRSHSK